jgi:preprotein translocase subunit SecA
MGIKAEVLNAKYHEKEAEIVAQAGRKDAVTIATNMAGRGTDILLGGNAEMLAKRDVRQNPTKVDFDERLKFYTAQCQDEKKAVLSAGGLAIIGTERHESRRIDNQLRGRSGRQGDPGSSRFFLSMEDKLMKHFGNPKLQGLLLKSMEEGKPIEHRMVNKAIERAQKSVENRNFDIRKHLLEYDDVMNRQRNTFYALRKSIFERNPRTYIEERAHAILQFLLDNYKEEAREKSADAEKRLQDKLMEFFGYTADLPQPIDAHLNDIREALHAHIDLSLNQKWEGLAISQATIDGAERFFLLGILDRLWKDHMRNMDALKEGIGLQGYAQKDPLIEYKRESFEMYQALLDRMDEETVKFMVRAKRISEDSQRRMEAMRAEEAKAMKMASRNEEDQKPKTFKRDQKKIGPNDPCPCGSGIKYKKCHGKP